MDEERATFPGGGRRALAAALVLLVGVLSWAADAPAAPATNKLVAQTWALNRYVRELDGQWQGNIFASDGNCYFFSSTHEGKHGAAFFRYDPRTGDLKMLCEDIGVVCGEDPKKTVPQGKVHSDIVEVDGWLYFATHLARYSASESAAYPGAHVVGYEMATGKFRDYGILHPHYSVYSGFNVDARRKLAYAFVRPFSNEAERADGPHLYRLDLASGRKEDLGRLYQGGGSAYHFFMDADGNCWFTARGAVLCARPDSSKIERWENAVPEGRAWCWAQALPDGRRCLFTTGNGVKVWLFDSTKKPDSPEAFQALADIGPSELGMVYDGRRVFYIQRADRKPFERGGGAQHDLHLCSLDLDANPRPTVTDHGLLVDAKGRQPWKIASLSTDGKGRVFMVGAWHVLPEEEKEIGIWKGASGKWCGQFLAVVDLSAQPPKEAPARP